MKIFIKSLTEKIFELEVESSESIKNIKHKIRTKENLDPSRQILIFQGKQLKDNLTVSDYNIQDGTTIHLILRLNYGNKIYIDINEGKTIEHDYVSSDSIKNVKDKIHKIEGIPPNRQCLIFQGKQLEDNLIISENYKYAGATFF